jgi:hypothetical protein
MTKLRYKKNCSSKMYFTESLEAKISLAMNVINDNNNNSNNIINNNNRDYYKFVLRYENSYINNKHVLIGACGIHFARNKSSEL